MTSVGPSVGPDRHNGQPTSLCRHQRCIFCRSASWWRVQAPRTLPRRQPSTPPAASPRRAAAPGLQPRRNIPNTRRRLRRRPASAAPLPPLPPVPPRRCPPKTAERSSRPEASVRIHQWWWHPPNRQVEQKRYEPPAHRVGTTDCVDDVSAVHAAFGLGAESKEENLCASAAFARQSCRATQPTWDMNAGGSKGRTDTVSATHCFNSASTGASLP